jgi:isopentenyldiphosphate isomerase
MEFIQVYQNINDGPFTLNVDEIETGDWFSKEEISKRVLNNDLTMTETFKIIWQKYSEEHG